MYIVSYDKVKDHVTSPWLKQCKEYVLPEQSHNFNCCYIGQEITITNGSNDFLKKLPQSTWNDLVYIMVQ